MIEALRASIKTLLEHPNELRWTVQGFGMLRCYLDPDKTYRLNIWDSEFLRKSPPKWGIVPPKI